MASTRFVKSNPLGTTGESETAGVETTAPRITAPVVHRALLLIAEHLVGLADLFELLRGVRGVGDVRVVLHRELAIRLLDLILGGVLGDAQQTVVISGHSSSFCEVTAHIAGNGLDGRDGRG